MATDAWCKPNRARRWHRFRNGRSLCGRWSYFLPPHGVPPRWCDECQHCTQIMSEEQDHAR